MDINEFKQSVTDELEIFDHESRGQFTIVVGTKHTDAGDLQAGYVFDTSDYDMDDLTELANRYGEPTIAPHGTITGFDKGFTEEPVLTEDLLDDARNLADEIETL